MWFLKKMFKNKRAQSTAEYGILFAAVIAIAAGVLTVSLKNAVGSKHDKSLEYMLSAGNDALENEITAAGTTQAITATTEELRRSQILETGYKDAKVMAKDGSVQSEQTQTTTSDSVSITKIGAGN